MDRDLFLNAKKGDFDNMEKASKTIQLVLGGSMSLMFVLLSNLWDKKGAPVYGISYAIGFLFLAGLGIYLERCYTLRFRGSSPWIERRPHRQVYMWTLVPTLVFIVIAW